MKCFQFCFNSAFKFNLRRYTKAQSEEKEVGRLHRAAAEAKDAAGAAEVGWCSLTVSKHVLKPPMVSALEPII